MTQDTSSFKKVAIVTGLSLLLGMAKICDVDAATITSTQHFRVDLLTNSGSVGGFQSQAVSYLPFDPGLGILQQVLFDLDSSVRNDFFGATAGVTVTNHDFFLGNTNHTISSMGGILTGFSTFPYDFTGVDGTAGGNIALSRFTMDSLLFPFPSFSVFLACQVGPCGSTFQGDLSLTYVYEPSSAPPVPLPAALPLFATGLGLLGLLGWRRRRKAV